MNDFEQWIGVFTQTPLAVILLVFMYMVLKLLTNVLNKLIELLDEAIKIIKQQERK
jgi:hypothetical protein